MKKEDKIHKVMSEFEMGKLKMPNGDMITNAKQAIAIALSEAKRMKKKA